MKTAHFCLVYEQAHAQVWPLATSTLTFVGSLIGTFAENAENPPLSFPFCVSDRVCTFLASS